MKKMILTTTAIAALVLASCGKSEVCDCADTFLEMSKEMKAMQDAGTKPEEMAAKMAEIETKYKADMEKCQKLDEGKSEAEKKAMEKELKECESFKEMEALMKK
jgi:hypothetical protein